MSGSDIKSTDGGILTCRALMPFWPMYLDGELQDADAKPYLEHLEQCGHCRGLVEGEQRFRQVFRAKAVGREVAPQALRQRVESMTQSPAPSRSYRWALATGAMGMLMVVTFTTQSGFSPMLQEVAEKHRAELPMDVASKDPLEVERFLERHLPRVHMPHLNAPDAQLAGARVVDLPGQHRGVIVRYLVGPNARPVSVVVYSKNPAEDVKLPYHADAGSHRVFLDRVGSLQAAVWNAQDSVYSMIGEIDERQLLNLVSAAE